MSEAALWSGATMEDIAVCNSALMMGHRVARWIVEVFRTNARSKR